MPVRIAQTPAGHGDVRDEHLPLLVYRHGMLCLLYRTPEHVARPYRLIPMNGDRLETWSHFATIPDAMTHCEILDKPVLLENCR